MHFHQPQARGKNHMHKHTLTTTRRVIALGMTAWLSFTTSAWADHALVLFGEPKYPANFKHFNYVNPNAPKGGTVRLDHPAGFDSLNPFILKGLPAPGLSYLFESLMIPALDEPQSYYGLIADDVVFSKEINTLTPITADDVVFSFHTLRDKGDPSYKLQYQPVASVTAQGKEKVIFTFQPNPPRDIPFIVASMPIISQHYYQQHDFEKSTLTPPLGSGAYTITNVDAGRSITYTRNPNYWAKDLPSRSGHYNFQAIRYDVYRDDTVALEALKAHATDLHEEFIARNWATAYNSPAVAQGKLIKYAAPHKIPRGMQAFLFNTRLNKFSDARVREAISQTLDFEWMNHTIFYDAYQRNVSFFQNTDFAARNLPDTHEIALLSPYKTQLPKEVFTTVYNPPKTDGAGNPRKNLLYAQQLLNDAGWHLKDGKRIHDKTGEELTIEFLVRQRTFERVVASMIRNLKRLGISSTFRLVDDAQYQKRIEHKDFDLISVWWNQGVLFPGNEQTAYWKSTEADVEGSQNLSGLKDPVVDMLLDTIGNATSIETLTTASRALDRTLLWQHLIIPHWSINTFRVAYWDMFEKPAQRPDYALGFDTWWMKANTTDAASPSAQPQKATTP
jgi:microcin C transport system substrate-binding protein